MNKQRGVAIVLAMSVVALATLTATAMTVSQSTWAREIELSTSRGQALLLMHAGIDWSRAVLKDDRRTSMVDHIGEAWALRLPSTPVDNGSVKGYIEDQQGKFNLNNLLKNNRIDPAQREHFKRLLSILSLPESLAGSLADAFLDSQAGVSPHEQTQPLVHIDELAGLPGFDIPVRAKLRPFITVLPEFTAINVNTASAEVLSAVIDGLSLENARLMTTRREQHYFRHLPDFFNQLPAGLTVPSENISVDSHYFMVNIQTTMNGAQVRGSSLLVRDDDNWPLILWQKSP